MDNERKYLVISIKHTTYGWKLGKPCALWGWERTADDEERCFAGYTLYPTKAELYTIKEVIDKYGDTIINPNPISMVTVNLCKNYANYDSVLIDIDRYILYCELFEIPTCAEEDK